MVFYPNQLFHIYNQGNNRQTIFFSEENYNYFIWKMKAYLLPFGELISYCLMPTHFHWQFYVERIDLDRKTLREKADHTEWLRRKEKYGDEAIKVDAHFKRTAHGDSRITLNESIGILQNAYARSINKEKGWSGSVFRKECKAKDGCIDETITLIKNGKFDYRFTDSENYRLTCFEYIHKNPVESGLVNKNTEWQYSSARDYAGLRSNSICNLNLGRKILELELNSGGNLKLPPEF